MKKFLINYKCYTQLLLLYKINKITEDIINKEREFLVNIQFFFLEKSI